MDDLATPSDVSSSYVVNGAERARRMGAISGGLAVMLVGLTIWSVRWHGARSLEFYGIALVPAIGVCYLPLWQWTLRLDLTPDALRWRGVVRRGKIPFAKLVRVRNDPRYPPRAVIETTTLRRVRIPINSHMPAFARQLQHAAPHVQVNLTYPSIDPASPPPDGPVRRH